MKAFGNVGQTKFHESWKTAPKNFKSSQRYAVLMYSVWTWPHDHLMSMNNNWKAFDSDYAAALSNSRSIETSQNKILKKFLQPNTGPIAIDKSYSVKGSTKENQLMYGRPSVPNGTHQTDIVEVYVLDESIESGMMSANKAIQQILPQSLSRLGESRRWRRSNRFVEQETHCYQVCIRYSKQCAMAT